MRYKGKQIFIMICSMLTSILLGLPVSAAMWEEPAPVGSLKELRDWYDDCSVGAADMCRMTGELVIDTTVVLGETIRARDIGAIDFKIRVVKNGRLIINNPLASVQGPGLLIEVEQGGTLDLNQGAFYTSKGGTSVRVRQGGIVNLKESFKLNESVILKDDAVVLPPEEESTPPCPPEESTGSGNGGEDGDEAAPPAEERPPGPITDLAARVLSIESSGRVLIQLSFTPLPENAEKLYVYYSKDGENYERGKWQYPSGDKLLWEDNFLEQPGYFIMKPTQYLAYRNQEQWDKLWLKIKIVGSSMEGMSNIVKVERRAGAQSTEGDIWEDGSMDGNRGGGGQGEASRDTKTDENPESGTANPSQASHETGAWTAPDSGNYDSGYQGSDETGNGVVIITGMGTEKQLSGNRKETLGKKEDNPEASQSEETIQRESRIEENKDIFTVSSVDGNNTGMAESAEKEDWADRTGMAAVATVLTVGVLALVLRRRHSK